MGTACGGGATGKSTAHSNAPEPRRTSASPDVEHGAAPAPPDVIDRGRDFPAIAGSLVLYVRWLESDDPDPALVDRAYQRGSPPERVASGHITEMRRIGARVVEVDDAPFEFTIISQTRNVVTLRQTEHLAHREAIAADGRVLARDRARTEQYLISIARSNTESPWRVNLVERLHAKIEVQL